MLHAYQTGWLPSRLYICASRLNHAVLTDSFHLRDSPRETPVSQHNPVQSLKVRWGRTHGAGAVSPGPSRFRLCVHFCSPQSLLVVGEMALFYSKWRKKRKKKKVSHNRGCDQMCKVWGMFIKEETGVCAANPPKLKSKARNKWVKLGKKWCKNGKCKNKTMPDSFPQINGQQPDSTLESWAHVTLKNYHPDPAS